MRNLSQYIKNVVTNLGSFSKRTGISEQRLNNLIEETEFPIYSELVSISELSGLPISFLVEDFKKESQYEVLFRKQYGSATDDVVINNFNFYVENILKIQPDVSRVENIRAKIQPVANTVANAEALAFYFRQVYFDANQYDPLINLPSLLSNNLNFIVKVNELGKKADGASASINNLIFLIISPRFEGRMLFTLAHELGHVLNHHENGDFVYFDKINLNPKDDKQKVEGFANAFASSLLLPEKGIAKMIKKVRDSYQISDNSPLSDIEILYISRFYGVSFDVAAYRCELLNLIPQGGAYSLSTKIKNDFGSAEKRADELGISPRETINFPTASNFVLDKVINLINEGEYSIGKIAEMISVPVNTILEHHSNIG